MEPIFLREEIIMPNEEIVTNQIREVSLIGMILTLVTTGMKIKVKKFKNKDGEYSRTMHILTKYAHKSLDTYLALVSEEYQYDEKYKRGYIRVMRQLRWLNIARRTWPGLYIGYDEDEHYETYKVMYDFNYNGDISAVIKAADIIVDENELGFYAYFMTSGVSKVHYMTEGILRYLRTALQTNEEFKVKYNSMQTQCLTTISNWRSSRKDTRINEDNGEYVIILMLIENIRQIAIDCSNCSAQQACCNIERLIERLREGHLSVAEVIQKTEGLYNSKLVAPKIIIRNFKSCFIKKTLQFKIRIVVDEELKPVNKLTYHIYCDEWLKDKIMHCKKGLVYEEKLEESFKIVAGEEHETSEYVERIRSYKVKKQRPYMTTIQQRVLHEVVEKLEFMSDQAIEIVIELPCKMNELL